MSFKQRNIERLTAVCNDETELASALKEVNDLDEDYEVKVYIELGIPGTGRQRVELLSDVPIIVEATLEE